MLIVDAEQHDHHLGPIGDGRYNHTDYLRSGH